MSDRVAAITTSSALASLSRHPVKSRMAKDAKSRDRRDQQLWNADESRILTASGDGTARQWYARMEDLLDASCEQTPRNMTLEEWRHLIGDEPYRPTCPDLTSGAKPQTP